VICHLRKKNRRRKEGRDGKVKFLNTWKIDPNQFKTDIVKELSSTIQNAMNELKNTPDNLNNPNYLQQFEQFIAKLYGGKINNAFKPNSSASLGMYFFMGVSLISMIFGMSFMNSMNERFGDMMNDMKVMFGTAKEVVVKTYDKGKTVVDMVDPTKNHKKEVFNNYLQEHYIIRSELMELFKNNALYGENGLGLSIVI